MVRGFYAKPSFFRISATICCGVGGDFDRHRGLRFFQVSELAGQNLFAGKVSLPRAQAFCDQVGTSLQVHEPDLRPNFEFPPVAALQGGTRQHNIALLSDPMGDRFAKSVPARAPDRRR